MTGVSSEKEVARAIGRKVLSQIGIGVVVLSLPIGVWWYWSVTERKKVQDKYSAAKEGREQLPTIFQAQDTYDYIISTKCLPGDVVIFDRRCDRCASSPWAAFSCVVAKSLLCNIGGSSDTYIRSVESGSFDHIGLIVPGYVKNISDKYDATNLLLLEATPSGIVARPLKERLELSTSQSILLLQLNCPGEQRDAVSSDQDDEDNILRSSKSITTKNALDSRQLSVIRTREHIDKELCGFRDSWIAAGIKKGYKNLHSTIVLGGAIAYGTGLSDYISGPVSPSAYLVLMGLQSAAAAPAISEKDTRQVKVEDYLRDYRMTEQNAVRLRPGWRFLAPKPLKETSRM